MEKQVAYFCMEYGLHSSFKQYAGGLGILAGDHLKGAHDLDLPLVAVGLLWKQGYTDQYIHNGVPYDSYSNQVYDFLEDTKITVSVKIRQHKIICKVWKCQAFGNAPLYLLDTDLDANKGGDRWITGQLYGWFGEERVAQEMILGIGGLRALRALGYKPEIFHFNEGHALFAGFELLREKMDTGMTFEEAKAAIKPQVVFTTHTPIVQGNESHELDRLMYMGANNGLTLEQLVSLGGAPFNMTVAALRLAKKANAVAALHAKTANKMWLPIEDRCEIIGITNGIHLPTWVDPDILSATDKPDMLWTRHQSNKLALLKMVEERNGISLNPDALLIGFSRRAAPYKRSNFIFSDLNIMGPLLQNGKIKIVFSGKAHPLDDDGKEIVTRIVAMAKKYPNAVVFLENYDMNIGAALTRGSDIWLNNPRRPKEASGTSGMKAAMNGVLNFSILDGWWPEACQHGINGWQFGDAFESEDVEKQDAHDLAELYRVLLHDILPTYYGNRKKWIRMMQESIRSTRKFFGTDRMLKEYYETLYNA